MYVLLSIILLIGAVTSAQAADQPLPESVSARAEPCYVVIAVDVSGSMEGSDEPTLDATDREQTLRNEGQLAFLQLLPFLRSDLYVGVAHFSDRVRYALPSSETGPLLSWGQTFLSESACRNMVRPAEFQGAYQTDIPESMSWAAERIRAARAKYGDGQAKLIILSHGDPTDSARELSRGSGPILQMAKRLAEQRIEVYPVLISGASFAGGRGRLSSRELAAEELMHSVASMTGGDAYRLAQDLGFPDILMRIFGLGTMVDVDPVVSPYDWAVVMVGDSFESITVHPPAGIGAAPLKLAGSGGLETAAGIYASVISSRRHRTCVLRRPETRSMISRSWQGRWDMQWSQKASEDAVRIYRIPEFLIRVEAIPELPWWLHEKVQLRTQLLDRHRGLPGLEGAEAADGSQRLSVRITANAAVGANSFLLEEGRWTVPGRVYETDPLTVGASGLYKVTTKLRDRVGDVNVPILDTTSDMYVHSECVGLEVVSAADAVLRQVPPASAQVRIDAQGGQQVYFRTVGKGEFGVELLSGILHLEPLSQTEWPLRKDANGNLVSSLVPLVDREERLRGRAEVNVRTFTGVRHIQLPEFELAYVPAPMRIECAFADQREALWVGEYHRQPLTISAFPVFDRFLDDTVRLFPDVLASARIRTVDMSAGTTQAMGPVSRLLERPKASGYEGRTVEATYFVESANPIPPADKCEIDLGPAMPNVGGAVRVYAVVDPVAEGLFRWAVRQQDGGERPPAVSETLYCGESIRFSAEWRPDQKVSAVRFEIPQQENESLFVDVPVEGGAAKASIEQVVSALEPGQVHPVYVHVTMQPPGANRPVQVKLKAGQFRAEDRRVVLEDLTIGGDTPTDMPARTWESQELPLQAVFSGYVSGDPRHTAAVEQFKKACKLAVTSRTGQVQVQDITNTVEWLEVEVDGPAKTCRLRGHAVYTPRVAGRATVELVAEVPAAGAAEATVRRAYANVMAREPYLVVTIHRLTPGGQEPVFDSRQWVGGDGGLSTSITRFSTHLRMNVRADRWTTSRSEPLRMTVRLLQRASSQAEWSATFSEEVEVTTSKPFSRDVQVSDPGEYAFEVAAYDLTSGARRLYFLTPVVTSIRQQDVEPSVAPPSWLTSRVRQWPFEFRVTLYEDAVRLSRLQSVAFQFLLPGQTETWFEGAALPVESAGDDGRVLSVLAPPFMPPAEGLTDGMAEFRLSSQGLEFTRWDYPNIRVIPPVMEGIVLSRKDGGRPMELAGAELAFDGSSELWVRPAFRATPELQEQWVPSEMTVYLWPDEASDLVGRQAEVRVLESLQGQDKTLADVQSFKIDKQVNEHAVRVLARRTGWRFWGFPKPGRSERYSLVAAVAYRPTQADGESEGPAAGETVVEWSEVHAINLDVPWIIPLCWWPVGTLLIVGLCTTVLRLLVPNPSKLALDMRLEENIAIVEPVRLDNPVLVDLHETPLASELRLYTRYLAGRWALAGRAKSGLRSGSSAGRLLETLVQTLALLAAPTWVILRRALCARRWAWAAIIPRTRGNARQVRTGLLCVWTGLAARKGKAWSSQSGVFDLPQNGQVKSVNLDLPYWVDGVDRTMRVTVRIRRIASEAIGVAAAEWQGGEESGS